MRKVLLFTAISFLLSISSVYALIEAVETTGDVGKNPAIALDTSGDAHVSARDDTNHYLVYCNNTDGGTWTCTDVQSNLQDNGGIAIDSQGNIHIACQQRNYESHYCNNTDGGTWTCTDIQAGGGEYGIRSTIAINTTDVIHVFYRTYYGSSDNRGTHCWADIYNNVSWTCVDATSGNEIAEGQIAIGSDNVVQVAYRDVSQNWVYGNNSDDGSWSFNDLEGSTDGDPVLAIDSNNYPHSVAYSDDNDLRYRNATDGWSWTVKAIETTDDVGCFPSIAIGSQDYPHILYGHGTDGHLKYCNTTDFSTYNCEDLGDITASSSGHGAPAIAIKKGRLSDSTSFDNDVHIVYYNTTGGDLYYGKLEGYAVETYAPFNITFVHPTILNSYIPKNFTFINVTSDVNLTNASLEWNGTLNETMNKMGSGKNWFLNKTDLLDGYYTFKVFGTDANNNTKTTNTSWVVIDTISPILTNPIPADGSYIQGTPSQLFKIDVTDISLNPTKVSVHYQRSGTPTWLEQSMNCYGPAPDYICNASINLYDDYAEDDIIQFYFNASDMVGHVSTVGTETEPNTVTIDRTPPQVTNSMTNSSNNIITRFDAILLSVEWQDNYALKEAHLYTNETGSMKYNKTVSLSGTSDWSNFTWYNPEIKRTVVAWRVYSSDLAENENFSENYTFTVYDLATSTTYLDKEWIKEEEAINITCQVKDSYSKGIANYPVEIYSGITFLTSGLTDSSGSFNYYWTSDIPEGNNTIICAIHDNSEMYYKAVSNGTASFTADYTLPVLTDYIPVDYTKGTEEDLFQIQVTEENLDTSSLYYKRSGTPTWKTETLNCDAAVPDYTCDTTIDLWTIYAEGDIIQFYFEATDEVGHTGNNGTSSIPNTVTIDRTPPSVINSGIDDEDKIVRIDGTVIYAQWSDNYELKTATLSTNETGEWEDHTTIDLSGIKDWSNFTWYNSLPDGTVVAWKIYATDAAGHETQTETDTFTAAYGRAKSEAYLSEPYRIKGKKHIDISCLVKDVDLSIPISNYYTEIYFNDSKLTDGTTIDGWFNYISPLQYGTYKCAIYDNDSLHYLAIENGTRTIFENKTHGKPKIIILSPENTTYESSSVSLTFTVDSETSWMGYSLDDEPNVTIPGNTTLTDLSYDNHNIIVYAEDTDEETGSSGKVYFEVSYSSGGGGCPHVYTWDGNEYVLDNNLIQASENPYRDELDVNDYYKLEKPLVPENGKYSLMIGEFEQEHSYFDEVQLLAIDHDSNVKMAPSPFGEILTYKNPIPTFAYDNEFNDVTFALNQIDGNYFEGSKGDSLILNFGRVTSKNAKLVMRSDLPPKRMKWSVHVQVLKDGEWEEVAIVIPRNYWADDAVDLSDYLTDEDFVVRLYFTSTHKIDFVGLDTSEPEEFDVKYGNLVSATHSEEGNVKQKLVKSDETYAELIPGQNIKLDFTLPNNNKAIRDFIFYSRGHYYKIE